MGRANVESKIRQWGAESEKLCMLVGSTAQTADRSALNISNRVSELLHQVTKKYILKIMFKESGASTLHF